MAPSSLRFEAATTHDFDLPSLPTGAEIDQAIADAELRTNQSPKQDLPNASLRTASGREGGKEGGLGQEMSWQAKIVKGGGYGDSHRNLGVSDIWSTGGRGR